MSQRRRDDGSHRRVCPDLGEDGYALFVVRWSQASDYC